MALGSNFAPWAKKGTNGVVAGLAFDDGGCDEGRGSAAQAAGDGEEVWVGAVGEKKVHDG